MTRAIVSSVVMGALLFANGCGNPQAEKLGSGSEGFEWEAHSTLFSPELVGGVQYALQMNDVNSARQTAASEDFKAALDQFEHSELPSSLSEKQSQKAAVVSAGRELIEAATSNTGAQQLNEAIEKLMNANRSLTGGDQAQ